jgi:hypothetical protein
VPSAVALGSDSRPAKVARAGRWPRRRRGRRAGGPFLRITDLRSRPANATVAASRSTPPRHVVSTREHGHPHRSRPPPAATSTPPTPQAHSAIVPMPDNHAIHQAKRFLDRPFHIRSLECCMLCSCGLADRHDRSVNHNRGTSTILAVRGAVATPLHASRPTARQPQLIHSAQRIRPYSRASSPQIPRYTNASGGLPQGPTGRSC